TARSEGVRTTFADAVVSGGRDVNLPRPRAMWVEQTNLRLRYRPLQTPDVIFFFSGEGSAVAYLKYPREVTGTTTELYRFSTDKKLRRGPGHSDAPAYIGSEAASLYAIALNNGKLRWRFTAGSPVSRRPAATDKDVFVTSANEGLARLDRATGDAPWRIPYGR